MHQWTGIYFSDHISPMAPPSLLLRKFRPHTQLLCDIILTKYSSIWSFCNLNQGFIVYLLWGHQQLHKIVLIFVLTMHEWVGFHAEGKHERWDLQTPAKTGIESLVPVYQVQTTNNCIGRVMVSVLGKSWFGTRASQTKDYRIGIRHHTALRRRR